MKRVPLRELQGGSAQENASIIRGIFQGEGGPLRDVVLLNAGAAIMVGGKASSLKEGVQMAAQSIDTGSARKCLEQLVQLTESFSAGTT